MSSTLLLAPSRVVGGSTAPRERPSQAASSFFMQGDGRWWASHKSSHLICHAGSSSCQFEIDFHVACHWGPGVLSALWAALERINSWGTPVRLIWKKTYPRYVLCAPSYSLVVSRRGRGRDLGIDREGTDSEVARRPRRSERQDPPIPSLLFGFRRHRTEGL